MMKMNKILIQGKKENEDYLLSHDTYQYIIEKRILRKCKKDNTEQMHNSICAFYMGLDAVLTFFRGVSIENTEINKLEDLIQAFKDSNAYITEIANQVKNNEIK